MITLITVKFTSLDFDVHIAFELGTTSQFLEEEFHFKFVSVSADPLEEIHAYILCQILIIIMIYIH